MTTVAERRYGLMAGAVIALAVLAAYADGLAGPFVLDDTAAIAGNPTIRHLAALGRVLSPPSGGGTAAGRPLLNLSLALNYAISGLNPWSYHALNVLIHLLAGLTLFGVVRRTLRGMAAARSTPIALAAALLWAVHPLQTESVTYVVQRAESLMGLCYLLTLYGFIRYADGTSAFAKASADKEAGRGGWAVLAILACLFGMATKEVMASAPVIVFLYDRTFVSGTFGESWRRHGRLHLALAATWVLLGWLILGTHGRGGSVGFGLGVGWWSYALTQFPAIVRYLRLSAWPHPLVFDYGTPWVGGLAAVWPEAVAVAALAAATAYAFLRPAAKVPGDGGRALGFAGVWFFAILAPTSLVPGIRQTMAEHRMYLALAPLAVVAAVILLRSVGGRVRAYLGLVAILAASLGAVTARRNQDYRSALALWGDTVAKCPSNPYAQTDLGVQLFDRGRAGEAIGHYQTALRLKPDLPEAHYNFGKALEAAGRWPEAAAEYAAAVRYKPTFVEARNNLGLAYYHFGMLADAEAQFRAALQLEPDDVRARNNLGIVLTLEGRLPEAVAEYEAALRLSPDQPAVRANLDQARRALLNRR